jgi:hypothetical protein
VGSIRLELFYPSCIASAEGSAPRLRRIVRFSRRTQTGLGGEKLDGSWLSAPSKEPRCRRLHSGGGRCPLPDHPPSCHPHTVHHQCVSVIPFSDGAGKVDPRLRGDDRGNGEVLSGKPTLIVSAAEVRLWERRRGESSKGGRRPPFELEPPHRLRCHTRHRTRAPRSSQTGPLCSQLVSVMLRSWNRTENPGLASGGHPLQTAGWFWRRVESSGAGDFILEGGGAPFQTIPRTVSFTHACNSLLDVTRPRNVNSLTYG